MDADDREPAAPVESSAPAAGGWFGLPALAPVLSPQRAAEPGVLRTRQLETVAGTWRPTRLLQRETTTIPDAPSGSMGGIAVPVSPVAPVRQPASAALPV